jgi:NitT/TauT family transport system substrate-binding protein
MRRRDFVRGVSIATAASALGTTGSTFAAEPPPETKRLRLPHRPSLCEAPAHVAEELFRGEGFTDIKYIKTESGKAADGLAAGDIDIGVVFGPPMILRMDTGEPSVFLAGVHVGCAELFVGERIRTARDLKGKTAGIVSLRDPGHALIGIIAAHVGLNPESDITWATHPRADLPRLLAAGKIDAFLEGPPAVQEIRAQKIARVLLNLLTDRPWSQYYCCMIVANRDFVRRHPVATKRAMRAILKASELCALQPEKVAAFLVDKGYVERSDYAVQAMKSIVYGKWREYDPEDAVRFYALRLYEGGMIKSSPQKILAQGTDWRFLNELKKELKS